VSTVDKELFGALGHPQENEIITTDELEVVGWCFSTLGEIVTIQILIDDKKVGETKNGIERKDVFEKFSDYKSAINSGFRTQIKLDGQSAGTHVLKVLAKSNNTEKLIGKKKIKLSRNKIFGDISMPFDRDVIKSNELEVKGWSFSTVNQKVLVSILIDGKKVAETKTGLEMSDVQRQYPQWKSSLNSGFFTKLDLSKFKDGNHILKIISFSKDTEMLLGTINFELKRI